MFQHFWFLSVATSTIRLTAIHFSSSLLYLITAPSPTVTLPHQSPMTDWHIDKQQHTYSIWELLRASSSISTAKKHLESFFHLWNFSQCTPPPPPPPSTKLSAWKLVATPLSFSFHQWFNLSLIQHATCPPLSPQIQDAPSHSFTSLTDNDAKLLCQQSCDKHVINVSLPSGNFPTTFKQAWVTPLFNKKITWYCLLISFWPVLTIFRHFHFC